MKTGKNLIRELFTSGVLKIDSPGGIFYNNFGFLGSRKFSLRLVYLFEEFYSELYLDTVEEIGEKDADDLWYRIGKDVAMRYLINFKGVKRDKRKYQKLADYFFKVVSSLGFFHLDSVTIEDNKLIASIEHFSLFDKTGSLSYLEGIISAIASYIFGVNTEAQSYLNEDKNHSIIIANPFFEERHYQCDKIMDEIVSHRPNMERIKSFSSGLSSFLDFFKFKVIEVDSYGVSLHGKKLMAQELGVPSMFSNNYRKIGALNIFEDSILKTSESIVSDLFKGHETVEKKIRVVRNICSAIGLGEIYFRRSKNRVLVSLLSPFFTKGSPSFVHIFLNGVLNVIYSSKFYLKSRNEVQYEYILK